MSAPPQPHRAALTLLLSIMLAGCSGASGETTAALSGEQLVAEGERLYGAYCAQCHGADLKGDSSGPPLLHPLYMPEQMSETEFVAATRRGVQPTHWEFGPMPIQAVPDDDLRAIIAYIRSVQRDEGTAS